LSVFATQRMTTVASVQQSIELVQSHSPAIVIASSGMATATLPSPKNTAVFVGFQAAGTRGRQLVDGAKQIRIRGRDIPVAAKIAQIDSMSAHADAGEILRWLSGFSKPPSMTYLVHGEKVALDALSARIQQERQWPTHVAAYLERVEL
jgi:metallo-beta-lactamase family protein